MSEGLAEHLEVGGLLTAILDTPPEDPEFDEHMTSLIHRVRRHIEEEESRTLPTLRHRLGGPLLSELGRLFDRTRRVGVRTR